MLWMVCSPVLRHTHACPPPAPQNLCRVWFDFDSLKPARAKPLRSWDRARVVIEEATQLLVQHTQVFLGALPQPSGDSEGEEGVAATGVAAAGAGSGAGAGAGAGVTTGSSAESTPADSKQSKQYSAKQKASLLQQYRAVVAQLRL